MNSKARYLSPADLPDASHIRHIAVMMLAEIGDILVTTPAIAALKARYPEAGITAIVRAPFAGLLAGNPCVDGLILLNNRHAFSKLGFIATLLRRRFDLFVDLHTPTVNTWSDNADVFRRNATVMRFTRARYRLGYATAQTVGLLTHGVAVPADAQMSSENIVDTTLRIVGCEGKPEYQKRLEVDAHALRWAGDFLDRAVSGRKYIVLFFGSKQPADVWSPHKVAAFVHDFLSAYPDYCMLVVGGEHEKAAAGELVAAMPAGLRSRLANQAGATSLQQTAALIGKCACMISTDSGPLHMADALGVPLVALFSSKNYPAIWRPRHARTLLLNKPVPCGPCFREVCDRNNECMERISVAEVLNAVGALLKAAP